MVSSEMQAREINPFPNAKVVIFAAIAMPESSP